MEERTVPDIDPVDDPVPVRSQVCCKAACSALAERNRAEARRAKAAHRAQAEPNMAAIVAVMVAEESSVLGAAPFPEVALVEWRRRRAETAVCLKAASPAFGGKSAVGAVPTDLRL